MCWRPNHYGRNRDDLLVLGQAVGPFADQFGIVPARPGQSLSGGGEIGGTAHVDEVSAREFAFELVGMDGALQRFRLR